MGFRGRLDEARRAELTEALALAKEVGVAKLEVDFGRFRLALDAKSREGWWHLQNADAELKIHEQASPLCQKSCRLRRVAA